MNAKYFVFQHDLSNVKFWADTITECRQFLREDAEEGKAYGIAGLIETDIPVEVVERRHVSGGVKFKAPTGKVGEEDEENA